MNIGHEIHSGLQGGVLMTTINGYTGWMFLHTTLWHSQAPDKHYWVSLSEPQNDELVVNFTSLFGMSCHKSLATLFVLWCHAFIQKWYTQHLSWRRMLVKPGLWTVSLNLDHILDWTMDQWNLHMCSKWLPCFVTVDWTVSTPEKNTLPILSHHLLECLTAHTSRVYSQTSFSAGKNKQGQRSNFYQERITIYEWKERLRSMQQPCKSAKD